VKNPVRRDAKKKKNRDASTKTIDFNPPVIAGRWLITAHREGRKNGSDGGASRL